MPRGDGKGKFYRLLQVPKEVFTLIKHYNKVLKKEALEKIKGNSDCSSGKVYELYQ